MSLTQRAVQASQGPARNCQDSGRVNYCAGSAATSSNSRMGEQVRRAEGRSPRLIQISTGRSPILPVAANAAWTHCSGGSSES